MVEEELRYIAKSDVLQLFEALKARGALKFTLKQIHEMPVEIRRCISSVKVRTENLSSGDDEQDTTVEIKLWDKTKALELCARSLGMLRDKVEITAGEEMLSRLDRAKRRARGETT